MSIPVEQVLSVLQSFRPDVLGCRDLSTWVDDLVSSDEFYELPDFVRDAVCELQYVTARYEPSACNSEVHYSGEAELMTAVRTAIGRIGGVCAT